MKFKVNGIEENLLSETTLQKYLEAKNLSSQGIIVVYNENVLTKEDWSSVVIQDNDSIEILRFLGGG